MRQPEAYSPVSPAPFYLVGDALCLDLLNTVMQGNDLLPDFDSYLRWLAQAGVLSEQETTPSALARWRADGRGADALAAVQELRATLREAVRAFAAGQPVPDAALATLNPLLARSPARAELVRSGEGHRLLKRFRLPWQEPADLLAPVAESAADLFSAADPTLLRQCASPECTMVFLDRTKNHRRRWCSMAVCGNRAKVAAHRARQKTVKAS